MINPVIPLFRKELRQNAFIYLFPFVMIITVFTFQKFLSQLISVTWAKNFAIAIPVALAFSYALQSFDLEENNQTRDFLLTKPVSGSQIINAKFFSGFVILLPLTILWQSVLVPDLIRWPDLLDFNSFWFSTYLLFILVVYGFSFTTGAWVKGPKKMLAAIFVSALGTIWFFFGWFQLLTLLYSAPVDGSLPLAFIIPIITLALLIILIKCLLMIIQNKLLNRSLTELIADIKTYLPLLLFPGVFYAVNLFSNPEIRPINSLFACLNGSEEPFLAVDIAKQPQGNLYALTDVRGRLGIAKKGEAPILIYQGEKDVNNLLSKLSWSPKGDQIAFNENGTIKVISLSQKEPLSLVDGDIAYWSADSNVLLVATKVDSTKSTGNQVPFKHYRLSYLSLASKEPYELQGTLSFPGSSMFWHSSLNTVIAITDFWQIALMNLNKGEVETIKLPQPTNPGPIFLSKITPSGTNSYRLALFTDLKMSGNNKKSFSYNLHLYNFSFDNKKPALVSSLKKLSFHDVLINAARDEIWGSNLFGAYRKINLP